MPCFSPLRAYRTALVNPETGKRGITFNPKLALREGGLVSFACGQCAGCRTDRARQWSVRCVHEAQMHEHNCFVTLTYDDEHVPRDYSLKLDHYQKFVKRLRRRKGAGLRFFGNGEYGDTFGRPHHHLILFNCLFDDRKKWSTRNGNPVWRSELLEELWPFGSSEIGSVSAQSAGYVARYALKKITGDRAEEHYYRLSPMDGRYHFVAPEFCTMSRRPGLGDAWLQKYPGDAYNHDFVVVDGRKMPVPKFYVSRLDEAAQDEIKARRKAFALLPAQKANSTKERLAVRGEVLDRKLKRLVRPL